MKQDLPTDLIDVHCNCGATMKTTRDSMAEYMNCQNCGSRVRVHTVDLDPEHQRHSTIMFASGANAPVRDTRTQYAIDLVRDGNYEKAIAQYEEILSREPSHRDIFYGIGFCMYKLKRYHEADVLLRIANDMGHPNAQGLLHKLHYIFMHKQ
jgi:tetratricopeptide (TPR) repeat protein